MIHEHFSDENWMYQFGAVRRTWDDDDDGQYVVSGPSREMIDNISNIMQEQNVCSELENEEILSACSRWNILMDLYSTKCDWWVRWSIDIEYSILDDKEE